VLCVDGSSLSFSRSTGRSQRRRHRRRRRRLLYYCCVLLRPVENRIEGERRRRRRKRRTRRRRRRSGSSNSRYRRVECAHSAQRQTGRRAHQSLPYQSLSLPLHPLFYLLVCLLSFSTYTPTSCVVSCSCSCRSILFWIFKIILIFPYTFRPVLSL